MYLDKVKDYKARQVEITEQMTRHEKADHNFYVTANMVMNLAARAKEIFESSEVTEKRQLLNLVFQNLQLKDGSLSFSVREPFLTMLDFKNRPKGWGKPDLNLRPAGYECAFPCNSELNRVNQNRIFLSRK